MLQKLTLWLALHPVIKGVLLAILVPFVGAIINWFTWKGTPEEWAAYRLAHPKMATAILLLRMALPHLRKIPAIAAFIPPESAPAQLIVNGVNEPTASVETKPEEPKSEEPKIDEPKESKPS